jgi:low affinity Fe/Cu permease
VGSAWAFVMAGLFIILWGIAGPLIGYSERWQLTVNTVTTIVTFLLVFIIQNTQNRDDQELNKKLDDLAKSVEELRGS